MADEVVLARHTLALGDQIEQEVEHLWLQGHDSAAGRQLPHVAIKYMIFKQISHVSVVSS
jgi:hypothetical protein